MIGVYEIPCLNLSVTVGPPLSVPGTESLTEEVPSSL